MAQLPTFIIKDQPTMLMQTRWKATLDPLLANLITQGNMLTDVNLKSGSNVINHLLGRKPQGWFLMDNTASVTVFRSAPFNDLTLTLTSSGLTTVSIWVF